MVGCCSYFVVNNAGFKLKVPCKATSATRHVAYATARLGQKLVAPAIAKPEIRTYLPRSLQLRLLPQKKPQIYFWVHNEVYEPQNS